MLGECARGEITSMTFVFQDGRISTTQAKDNQFLGTIAAANGNPCIAGSFHSDAALFLGASAGFFGIQAYGNALSQSQLSNVSSTQTGSTISSLIGSPDKYAFGQGFSASSQAVQKWWNQRVQNSFDFVYVPNVDLKTGKKLALNINITQEIPIDYDPKARKLFYGHDNCRMWRIDWINLFLNFKNKMKLLGIILLFPIVAACTTAGNAIPKGGQTMAQVYEESMEGANGNTLNLRFILELRIPALPAKKFYFASLRNKLFTASLQ